MPVRSRSRKRSQSRSRQRPRLGETVNLPSLSYRFTQASPTDSPLGCPLNGSAREVAGFEEFLEDGVVFIILFGVADGE